jgi:predicted CXXCH cytochrome family protein
MIGAPGAVSAQAAPQGTPHQTASVSTGAATPRTVPGGRQQPWQRADRGSPREASDTNTCLTCHSALSKPQLKAPALAYQASVHADPRIGCVGCHGGDPKDPAVTAHDWAGGFTPRPAHAEIVQLCGRCHSDPAFIRQFDAKVHTDQAQLFPLSLHGKLAAVGDENAPTCNTCHGTHDIQPAHSLHAPTHPRNVAHLCARCHDDPARMRPYGRPTTQVAKWQRSAHARGVEAGNPGAPSCTGCHDPHSATPPRASSVGRICGQCHDAQLEAFRMSPHSKAYRRLGLSECVPCHDPHEARRLNWAVDSPESVCRRCHDDAKRPRQVAEKLARLVDGARKQVRRARTRIIAAAAAGISVPGAAATLADIDAEETQLSVMVHSLDATRIRAPLQAVVAAAARVETLVGDAERVRTAHRRGYYGALVLCVTLFGLLLAKVVRLARRQARSEM